MNPRSLLIGSFDGLHIGHRFLIDQFKEASLKRGEHPTLLTYPTHPMKLIRPELENYYIDSDERRVKRVSKLMSTILCDFSKIHEMKAREFFQYLKMHYSDVECVYVGHDSTYGHDRVARLDELHQLAPMLKFYRLPKLASTAVSSTLLREAIKAGDLDRFYQLTQRQFSIQSKVIPGKQLGRTLGFPTANLYVDPSRVRLPNGVYWGTTSYKKNVFSFVANIGLRPTIDNEEQITIEAHLLDFDEDIYGKEIDLKIAGQVRDIKKFSSKDDLSRQIQEDIHLVRFLSRR